MSAFIDTAIFALFFLSLGGIVATLIDGRKLRQLSRRIDAVAYDRANYIELLERENAALRLELNRPREATAEVANGL